MRFRIQFDDGAVVGDTTDDHDLALINWIREAMAQGHNHLTIGIQGGRTKTVGDIRQIKTGGEA